MIEFIKKPRREPISLQLTAMIDIFSMIVIFLVMGTIFGASEVVLPNDFLLPKSKSGENVDFAPQLMISLDRVEFKALKLNLPLSHFSDDFNSESPEFVQLKKNLEEYAASLPPSSTSAGLLLNVMSDERLPYGKLYNVLTVFRKSGFETLLFVTMPKKSESP